MKRTVKLKAENVFVTADVSIKIKSKGSACKDEFTDRSTRIENSVAKALMEFFAFSKMRKKK